MPDNIIISGEKLTIFPVQIRNKEERSLLWLLFNLELQILDSIIKQEEKTQWMQLGKDKVKALLLSDYIVLQELQNLSKWLLQSIFKFSNVPGYKVCNQKSVAFPNSLRKYLGKQYHSQEHEN